MWFLKKVRVSQAIRWFLFLVMRRFHFDPDQNELAENI